MSFLRTFARDVCLAFALVVAAQLAAEESTGAPVALPKVTSKSYYLIDFSTDKVLSASAANEQLAPASLTKLMTAYVVFGALESGRIRLDERAHVSTKAWRTGGTRMFIDVNSDVGIDDLLHGLLIQSGNDAAVALAEHVAGSVDAFVVEMNGAAQKPVSYTHLTLPTILLV